jgi:hypothetical protein
MLMRLDAEEEFLKLAAANKSIQPSLPVLTREFLRYEMPQ